MPWLFPKEEAHGCAGGFPNGNYWSRQENDTDNAYILNGDSNGLNNNGNNDNKFNLNQVVCVP